MFHDERLVFSVQGSWFEVYKDDGLGFRVDGLQPNLLWASAKSVPAPAAPSFKVLFRTQHF